MSHPRLDRGRREAEARLRAVLGLMSITGVEFVYAEEFDMKPHGFEARLENTRRQMEALHA